MTGRLEPLIQRYFDCINQERWDDFPAIWAEDAEIGHPGSEPRHGRDAILAYYKAIMRAFKTGEHADRATRILESGDTATVEITFKGTMTNGEVLEFPAVDIIDFEGDLIKKLVTWYDSRAVHAATTRAAEARASASG